MNEDRRCRRPLLRMEIIFGGDNGRRQATSFSNRRIVDVEMEAPLIICGALDARGDPYALFASSAAPQFC
jgi:hypothetical protein